MNFVITIGREFGSGGRFLGQKLAERLGINFYDNELLEKVADESGLSLEYVKNNDEKKDGFFAFLGASDNPNVFTASQRVSVAQFNTIERLYEKESCVIVGRCANYVLRNKKNVVNIFISAPEEKKLIRLQKHRGMSEKEAITSIKKIDKQRAAYYNYFTDQIWGQASNYDLCINSQNGTEATLKIIIDYINAKLGTNF